MPFIQAHHIRRAKKQIQVLERFYQPEALYLIGIRGVYVCDVVDGAVPECDARVILDGVEYFPALFVPDLVAADTIHDVDRLDGFGSGKPDNKVRQVAGKAEAEEEVLAAGCSCDC